MMADCELCNKPAHEVHNAQVPMSLKKIDKDSIDYKKAIQEIMKTNKNLSRKDAEKLFETAYLKD